MSIVAGVDIGSLTSKVVIMKAGRIIGSSIVKSKIKPEISAEEAMKLALEKAKLKMEDLEYVVATGYGRDKISFVKTPVSEIKCHGRGAAFLLRTVRTIIDIGGQDCKVILLDDKARVIKFHTNDKCASGTGRFLEVMAKALHLELNELGEYSAKSENPLTFTSTCTVWAQADVVKYINSGHKVEDIAAGINNSMANRVATLARSIKPQNDVCMTGGVSKNKGVVNTLEKLLGLKIKKIRKGDPQLAGAIGAALIAGDLLKGKEDVL